MCEHLKLLATELQVRGIKETFRGQAWNNNTREWVYYDCVFILDKVRSRFNFPAFVKTHINDDSKSGMEAGFFCDQCKYGIIGLHPQIGQGKVQID